MEDKTCEASPFYALISRKKITSMHEMLLFGNRLHFDPEYVAHYDVFRLPVLLPRLVVMATINNQSQDDTRRREIALELMEAYVSLTCCCILFITLEKLMFNINCCRLVPSLLHIL